MGYKMNGIVSFILTKRINHCKKHTLLDSKNNWLLFSFWIMHLPCQSAAGLGCGIAILKESQSVALPVYYPLIKRLLSSVG